MSSYSLSRSNGSDQNINNMIKQTAINGKKEQMLSMVFEQEDSIVQSNDKEYGFHRSGTDWQEKSRKSSKRVKLSNNSAVQNKE